ncbi:LAQU0S13e02410g1_1 [Lachancea quebecensis]|uniref:LAQU0S13e02410g1_1 n=1 Tax=Lachancea quebecensis TaxID=1654605 RepID=A0A0P1KW54_9SACH|nr:LAQU0S13e02410g1_1 [Lachancea quebecensis]
MSIGVGVAIYAAIKPVLKIYVIILVGYLLARYNLVTVETSRGVSNMVVNAILPCLTFNKIVANISDKDIKEVGVLVLTAFLIFAVGGVGALITKWATNSPKQWYWGLLFAGIFPNISDLPIAYVQSMSNGSVFTSAQVDRGVAYCCIFLCTQSFLMMNFGMFRLVGLDFREPSKDEEQLSGDVDPSSHLNSKLKKSKPAGIPRTDSSTSEHMPAKTHDNTGPHMLASDKGSADISRSLYDEDENSSQSEADLGNEPQRFMNTMSAGSSLSSSSGTTVSDVFRIGSRHSGSENSHSRAGVPISISDTIHRMTTARSTTSALSASSQRKSRGRQRRLSQTAKDVINEYSAVQKIKTGEMDLSRPLSLTQEFGGGNAFPSDESDSEDEEFDRRSSYTHSLQLSRTRSRKWRRSRAAFVKKYKLGWLVYILVNFCRPASLGALLGIIFSMIPWVKALFVHTDVHMHQAPDGQPVLNFLMDFTAYIGNACVPLGLLLLGGTLARLEIGSLPKGFWKTIVAMTAFRLVVLPIVGIAWANKLFDINWIENDVAKFVVILTWAMPSATAQVYFTAFYTPLEGEHLQMDCLSVFFLSQYTVLFITLSIVVSYTLKVDLKV